MFLKNYVLKKPRSEKDKLLKKASSWKTNKQFGIDFQSSLESNFFDTLKTTW